MRHLFAFLFFLFGPFCSHAQNVFVQMFHPQYQELTPLVTDSLFIRIQSGETGEITRAIGYQHPVDLPSGWREVRAQEKPLALWRISQHTEQAANGQITYNDFIDSLKSDTLRSRMYVMGNQMERPDSVLHEIWRNGQWMPMQKTLLYYIGQTNGRRVEMTWNEAMNEWENVSKTQYTYDGQKRLTKREEEYWKEDEWTIEHSYQYAYRQNESKPKYAIWVAQGNPIDSTMTWYDFQGQEDSSKIYLWNIYQSAWSAQSKRILNGEEAKRALAGDIYAGNGAFTSNWSPKEQREFVSGEGVITNEPQEEILRKFNPISMEWQESWRRSIAYQPLPDGRIYGTIRINEFGRDSSWSETFFAEGWFHLAPDSLGLDPAKDRSETFTFSYSCGLYNPYVQNQTLTFPASEVTGDYELKIFGEDSRLVFQQRYNSSGLATVSAPLVPGLYLVSVSKGGVPLCTQKLVVH